MSAYGPRYHPTHEAGGGPGTPAATPTIATWPGTDQITKDMIHPDWSSAIMRLNDLNSRHFAGTLDTKAHQTAVNQIVTEFIPGMRAYVSRCAELKFTYDKYLNKIPREMRGFLELHNLLYTEDAFYGLYLR